MTQERIAESVGLIRADRGSRNAIVYIDNELPTHLTTPSSIAFDGTIDDTDSLFECAICLSTISDARILPCHHRFCRACIQGCVTAAHEQRRSEIQLFNESRRRRRQPLLAAPDIASIPIRCPTCRRNFSAVSDTFTTDGHTTAVMTKISDQQRIIRQLKRQLTEEEDCQQTLIAVSTEQELTKHNIEQTKIISELRVKLEECQEELSTTKKKAKTETEQLKKKIDDLENRHLVQIQCEQSLAHVNTVLVDDALTKMKVVTEWLNYMKRRNEQLIS